MVSTRTEVIRMRTRHREIPSALLVLLGLQWLTTACNTPGAHSSPVGRRTTEVSGYTYVVHAPFTDWEPLPLVGEASPVVSPVTLTVSRQRPDKNRVQINFKYITATAGEVRLAVTLCAYDEKHELLFEATRDTEDIRLTPQPDDVRVPVSLGRSPVNLAIFQLTDEILNRTEVLSLRFTEH